MTANYLPPSNLPAEVGREPSAVGYPQAYPATWGSAPAEEPGIPWGRYISALKRYKWLILLIVVAGTAAGFGATRFMAPEYQVSGTIWINAGGTRNQGPVEGDPLVSPGTWADLVKSPT